MKKQKKMLTLVLVLLLCFMTGCAGEKAKENEDSEGEYVESYQEEGIELPFSSEEEEMIGMVKNPADEIQIYTRETASKCCNVYTLQADQSFQKETCSAAESFIREASGPWTVSQGADGAVYFLYFDGEYIPHISRVKDGTVTEPAAEKLEKQVKSDSSDYPAAVLGAEDGSFLVVYMGNQAQYFDADGNLKYEIPVGSGNVNIRTDAALCGKSFLTSNMDRDKLLVYDLENEEESNQIELSPDEDFLLLRPGTREDFYILDSLGLHHVTKDGKMVETCIDASDMTALIEKSYPRFFETGKSDDCYILYKNGDGAYLLKYYSRQQKTKASAKTLKIIGMHESNTMKRAISEFEKTYPDVKVEFQSYEEVRKRGTLSETIRIMNTDILSEKNGADLIVLDGLPEDSYIKKGALADLTEFTAGLQGEDALLENLTARDTEKVYSLPARFSVPILYGTDHAMDQLDSLETVLAFLENPGDTPMFDYITYQFLAESLLVMNYDEISADLSNAAVIQKYMDAVTEMGKYVDASLEEVEISGEEAEDYLLYLGTASCLGRDKAAVAEVKQVTDLAQPFTFQKDYNQSIRLVDGLYIPYDSIGICAMSQNREEAQNFLKLLLSYTIQSIGMGEGFPVNEKAFQELTALKSESEVSAGWEEDGQEIHLTFSNPTKEDVESFKAMVGEAGKPLHMDFNVRELLLENVKRVYTGETGSESAAADTAQKLKLYLAED